MTRTDWAITNNVTLLWVSYTVTASDYACAWCIIQSESVDSTEGVMRANIVVGYTESYFTETW